jgi:hypothetical protein
VRRLPARAELAHRAAISSDEAWAQATAALYIHTAVCTGTLEQDAFEPFFFGVDDLRGGYRFGAYDEGFFRDPSNLMVELDRGTHLLFCFNRMVINCDRARACECPHDFNWDPEPR